MYGGVGGEDRRLSPLSRFPTYQKRPTKNQNEYAARPAARQAGKETESTFAIDRVERLWKPSVPGSRNAGETDTGGSTPATGPWKRGPGGRTQWTLTPASGEREREKAES
jgi:hypothetical protein